MILTAALVGVALAIAMLAAWAFIRRRAEPTPATPEPEPTEPRKVRRGRRAFRPIRIKARTDGGLVAFFDVQADGSVYAVQKHRHKRAETLHRVHDHQTIAAMHEAAISAVKKAA